MEDNELHDWMIASFGPLQGEAAYAQFSQLPDSIKDQIMAGGIEHLPKPEEVKDLMQAFTDGGINAMSDVNKVMEAGPINVTLAKSLAIRKAREGAVDSISATQAEQARDALSTVNLWLDSASELNPSTATADVLTPSGWAEATIGAWTNLAEPVAKSMNEALASVFAERLGGALDSEVSSMFAGPVPIPLPEGLKDPRKLMELLGSTSFAMQLGQASGSLAHEVFGSFDQGLVMTKNPAGALIPENIEKFAAELELPPHEVLSFLALRESAHARLYSSVPWLMPRIESLVSKYARGISIDLDAVEEQLRDAEEMNPEGIAGAVNMAKVGMKESAEQQEALASLETLLALVEGWVDAVTWRAGSPFLPHIEQLREMMRRRRASGGPAEQTFENLIGLKLRPRKLREAAAVWEKLTAAQDIPARDALWSHPDKLPTLSTPTLPQNASPSPTQAQDAHPAQPSRKQTDWDAELTKLLEEEGHDGPDGDVTDDADGSKGDAGNHDSPDDQSSPDAPDAPGSPTE